ncbi:MAG: ROK family protein [Chloroflexi bacterium]|nr:ROK family protein [Chloroflexota bacterium]
MKNLQAIKKSNRVTVLDFIRKFAPISRRQLSRKLQISPTTASAAVSDLIKLGLVREIGHGTSTGGRRPISLEINPKGGTVISVDVSSRFNNRIIRAAALDLKSNILTNIQREQQITSNETMFNAVRDVIHDLIASPDVKLRDAVAIGVSVPGLVNAKTGEVVFASFNVKHLQLGTALTDEFQTPVLVQNNEDAAALGEYRFGAGQDHESLAYLHMGTGIGFGFVINGRIYQHGRISAGELGHITVQADGPLCRCGNRGCLTTLVSSENIVKQVQTALIDDGYVPQTTILSPQTVDIHQVMVAAQAGDPLCQNILKETSEWAGIAVANIVNLLNPEVIVFGGELFEESTYFFSLVEQVIQQRALNDYLNAVQLTLSSLGRHAGLQGVGILALDTLLKSPTF